MFQGSAYQQSCSVMGTQTVKMTVMRAGVTRHMTQMLPLRVTMQTAPSQIASAHQTELSYRVEFFRQMCLR